MKYINPKRFTYRDEDGTLRRQSPTPAKTRLEILAKFTQWMFESLNSSFTDDVVGDPIKFNAKMVSLWIEYHEEWLVQFSDDRTNFDEQLKEILESPLATQTLASLLKEVKS